MSLSTHGVARVQPSTTPGIEPGTSWLAIRGLSNYTNLAHKIDILLEGFDSIWKHIYYLSLCIVWDHFKRFLLTLYGFAVEPQTTWSTSHLTSPSIPTSLPESRTRTQNRWAFEFLDMNSKILSLQTYAALVCFGSLSNQDLYRRKHLVLT